MKTIYNSALSTIMRRVKSCGLAIAKTDNEYSLLYWQKELALYQYKAYKIKQRVNKYSNVIKVDFQSKKRVA